MKKQYQTIGAQITNIVKNKNVLKSTIIKDSFYEKSYINLITPYSELLAKGRNDKDKHIYDFNRDFSEYIDCNKIDNAICHKLHNYIGVFEKRLKNFLAHKYCSKRKVMVINKLRIILGFLITRTVDKFLILLNMIKSILQMVLSLPLLLERVKEERKS